MIALPFPLSPYIVTHAKHARPVLCYPTPTPLYDPPSSPFPNSEAKWFVWHLLKKVPALRWTAEQAINSDWIKTFAPTGSGGGGYGAISPPPTSSSSTTSAATASSSSSLPALAWPSAELMPVGDNGGEGGPAVGVEGPDATPGASQQHHRRQQPSIRTRMVSSMRDYCKYGALRRTALMVVAYNQAPEKLRELRNEFSDFDTASDRPASVQTYLPPYFITIALVVLLRVVLYAEKEGGASNTDRRRRRS